MPNREEVAHAVIKSRAKVIMLQRSVIALGALAIAIVMSLLIYDVLVGFKVRDHLLDCTDPTRGAECYQAGADRTGEAVNSIVERTVTETIESAVPLHETTRLIVQYAAACADKPGVQTAEQIEMCVTRMLTNKEE